MLKDTAQQLYNSDEELESVKVDEEGNAYACGYSRWHDFPVAPGSEVFNPNNGEYEGGVAAVVIRYNGHSKQIQWGTFYGGGTSFDALSETKAHKVALGKGLTGAGPYAFVTGSTNSHEFAAYREGGSIFHDAHIDGYDGGLHRMWVGAFRRSNGIRDWATTHGQSGASTWSEHGMAIDVDEDGLLAVGGHVSHPEWGPITQYPTVAPPGAFTRSDGGGFFLVFDEQYQIKWCTQWGQQAPETMIRDMRIAPAEEGVKHMWITGSTASWFTYPNSAPLDVVPPTGGQGFYQPTDPSQFSMFVAKLDITHTHQIELSTYWGSNSIDVAYALALHEDQLWVVGSTLASTLDPDKAPYPGGGNYHRIVTNGETEAVILCFRTDPWDLWYGTLYGGSDKDVILSVTSDGAGRIYMIGDSRSPTGTLGSGNPPAYFAMENHGIPWTRDAFLIGIQAPPGQAPHLFWRTAFGGAGTERGWGIAATSDEVFICGATASQRAWGAGPMDFPLVEYQPGIPLGYFQYVNNYGTGSNPFAPWYDMEYFLDFHPWMLAQPEGIPWGYDAFMASFDVSATVGIPPLNSLWDTAGLHAVLLDQNGLWQLDLPGQGPWNIALYDAGGRLVEQIHVQHPQPTISLVARASGIYAIRVLNNHGAVYSSKLFKP